MRFKKAVLATPGSENAYFKGLKALSKADRAKVTSQRPTELAGSVNLDEALRKQMPTEPRWDYGIGANTAGSRPDAIFWIEIHPGTAGEVSVVLAKHQWLLAWLARTESPLGDLAPQFIWIASGKAPITPQSPQRKRLADKGIAYAGGHFTIP